MSLPGADAQQHMDRLRETLIERATQAQRIVDLGVVDATHHIVNFQGAYWSVQCERTTRQRWFTAVNRTRYAFDIDFETLFLKPGKLVVHKGKHAVAEDFAALKVSVEPVIVQW